jgi:sugar/nucleoside kinase (ribokinase family)
MNSLELREQCAEKLLSRARDAERLTAFIGLDGFVDEIIHVVDKRDDAEHFERIPTIARFAERVAGASGRSTNIELFSQQVKLGGNGPIMSNALAGFGVKVTYLGALGYPSLHSVFEEFSRRVEVHSITDPSHTDALEFDDGKIMLGKMNKLKELTWPNIQSRFGRENFAAKFNQADLVGFVNWTMIPYMSELWQAVLDEICPTLAGPRRKIFFDLADPEKRDDRDLRHALDLILRFNDYFDVIVGFNEKECLEVARAFGWPLEDRTPEGLAALARRIHERIPVYTIVVHPVSYALAVSDGVASMVEGPFIAKPVITTGAGDHFNAGFCLGKLLGFDNPMCVLTGVTASGHYVRTAQSPTIVQLAEMMRNWPQAGEK